MTDLEQKALLPAGLRDILPPDAAFEARTIERLIAEFAARGYARVKAPLVEFEEGLLSGPGAAMTGDTFRLMDPVSQRMMGVRADITPQIARIASSRLRNEPRPLRLSYSGEVLRVKGTQLRPERQFAQVGCELIGSDAAAADAETIVLAVEALQAVGVAAISVDINIPPLIPALFDDLGLSRDARADLRHALDHKDAVAVRAFGGRAAETLASVLAASGPAETAGPALDKIKLSGTAEIERARLRDVVKIVRAKAGDLSLTIDPVENRGFEYHTGISFTIFSPGVRGELGSGGRYLAAVNGPGAANDAGEPATGFTLYVDTLQRILPEPETARSIYLPPGTAAARARALREDGWVTVEGLDARADNPAEARRMKCTHWEDGGSIASVNPNSRKETP